jgi:hypothetical protein
MKRDISLIPSTLTKIGQLRPVSYLYEKDPIHHPDIPFRVGFIAQEVQAVYPDLVTENAGAPYTNLKGETFLPSQLSVTDMIPYLTRAIQEQQEQLNHQASLIAALQSQVSTLLSN